MSNWSAANVKPEANAASIEETNLKQKRSMLLNTGFYITHLHMQYWRICVVIVVYDKHKTYISLAF